MCQGRGVRGRSSLLSCQFSLGKKKKMPEDTQRHIGAPGLLLGGQGMAVYDEIMSDFNRTRAILKSIKDTPSP